MTPALSNDSRAVGFQSRLLNSLLRIGRGSSPSSWMVLAERTSRAWWARKILITCLAARLIMKLPNHSHRPSKSNTDAITGIMFLASIPRL